MGCADRQKALFVQRAQDACLRLQAHIADLIEEEGPAICPLEGAALFRGRTRRASSHGTATIAEELGLDVVFGDGGAVQLDEDAILAQGFCVHCAADKFLAGATFAVDKDTSVGGGHQLDLLAQRLHGDAVTGDAGAEGKLAQKLLVVHPELTRVDGVLEHDEGALEGERFFQKVVGAELGGAHGGFDGSVTTDDDDLRQVRRVHLADVAPRRPARSRKLPSSCDRYRAASRAHVPR